MTPADWRQRWRDDYEERWRVRVFDSGQTEEYAKQEAMKEVKKMAKRARG